MGAANVIAAYSRYAGHIPATSMQLLAWMAVVAKDDDPRPWYGQGHAALARFALGRGRETPIRPADIKAVERAITPLLRIGAITTDRRASVRRDGPSTVRYRLHLRVASSGRQPDDTLAQVQHQEAPHPADFVAHGPQKPSARPLNIIQTPTENRGAEELRGEMRSEQEEEVVDVHTAVTGTRARRSQRLPIAQAPGNRCPHGLSSRRRDDGKPSCTLCRRLDRGERTAHGGLDHAG